MMKYPEAADALSKRFNSSGVNVHMITREEWQALQPKVVSTYVTVDTATWNDADSGIRFREYIKHRLATALAERLIKESAVEITRGVSMGGRGVTFQVNLKCHDNEQPLDVFDTPILPRDFMAIDPAANEVSWTSWSRAFVGSLTLTNPKITDTTA